MSALATVSVVALELLEENDDELEVDTFSELVFIPLIIKDRRKANCVQGYAEDVVPSHTISVILDCHQEHLKRLQLS